MISPTGSRGSAPNYGSTGFKAVSRALEDDANLAAKHPRSPAPQPSSGEVRLRAACHSCRSGWAAGQAGRRHQRGRMRGRGRHGLNSCPEPDSRRCQQNNSRHQAMPTSKSTPSKTPDSHGEDGGSRSDPDGRLRPLTDSSGRADPLVIASITPSDIVRPMPRRRPGWGKTATRGARSWPRRAHAIHHPASGVRVEILAVER